LQWLRREKTSKLQLDAMQIDYQVGQASGQVDYRFGQTS